MDWPLRARNEATSLVEGGNVPECIVTTANARFKSSKEAGTWDPFFFEPQPEAKLDASRHTARIRFMAAHYLMWSRAQSAPSEVRGRYQPPLLFREV